MNATRSGPRSVWVVVFALWMAGCLVWLLDGPDVVAQNGNWTVPPAPPNLLNARFECEDGFVPDSNPAGKDVHIPRGWTAIYASGSAQVLSTRLWSRGVCDRVMYNADGKGWVEVSYGGEYDSVYIRSQDIETLPEPGKPFDIVLVQQVTSTIGSVYSLSAWMVTLCRNYQETALCPPGEYIVKAAGLDPLGGTDPDAGSVDWAESQVNYVDDDGSRTGWQNVRVGTRALSETLTVFLRMTAPYDQRGNAGFMDEASLVRGPYARFTALPDQADGDEPFTIMWEGLQSPDVMAMPGQTYELHYSVQTRPAGGTWRDLATETSETSLEFEPQCLESVYEFRVRAGAEQPEGSGGVAPNHRYPGAWSLPVAVYFAAPAPAISATEVLSGAEQLWLPVARRHVEC